MKRVCTTVLGLLCLSLTSCAGSKWAVKQPLSGDLGRYPVCAVSVQENVTEDVASEMESLKQRTIEEIQDRKLFSSVLAGDGKGSSEPCLHAEATITHIRKVSGGARFWGGAFAGRAQLKVDLKFIDAGSSECLGVYEILGMSGSTGMSGGTGSAIKETAEQIAKVLADQRKRKVKE